MPLYEYECTHCKVHTEHIQKFSDAEITQCPHCGGLLERVVSAPAISFKGGGWFADGYSHLKSSESSSENNSPSPSSSTSEASTSSSKDAAAPASSESSSPAPPAAPATVATSTSNSDSSK